MAASAVQIEANRANAQLSTGPRTEEGKQSSSKNALTDGLTAAQIFVRPDEQAQFDIFQAALRGEMKPDGLTQSELFDQILHAGWNIRRCYKLETDIQNEAMAKGSTDAIVDDDLGKKLDRIYRYKKMHDSTRRRAIAELRQLQTEALCRTEVQQVVDESILTDTTKAVIKLRRTDEIEQKANLHVLRQHIEACIAPPPLPRLNRLHPSQ
jgi:hypothetical protein